MRAILFTLLLLATFVSAQPQRQLRPQRQPELYEQNSPPTAQGVWFKDGLAGSIGWQGYPVPMGSQVVLKGRNFASQPVLLMLRYSAFAEADSVLYVWPRLAYDFYPVGWESCGFDLPPFILGPVEAAIIINGKISNTVKFTVL